MGLISILVISEYEIYSVI